MLTPSATLGLEGLHSSRLPFPSQEQQHPPTAVRPLRRRMLLATTCAVTAPKLWQSVKGGEGQRKEIEWDCKFGTTIFFGAFFVALLQEKALRRLTVTPSCCILSPWAQKRNADVLARTLAHVCAGNCVQIFVNSTMKNCHLFLTRDQMRSAMFES